MNLRGGQKKNDKTTFCQILIFFYVKLKINYYCFYCNFLNLFSYNKVYYCEFQSHPVDFTFSPPETLSQKKQFLQLLFIFLSLPRRRRRRRAYMPTDIIANNNSTANMGNNKKKRQTMATGKSSIYTCVVLSSRITPAAIVLECLVYFNNSSMLCLLRAARVVTWEYL